MLKVWNVSLVLATGVLAILGTFLVRSGILQSIHAFGASTLGVPFLVLIVVMIAGSIALVVARARSRCAPSTGSTRCSRARRSFLLNNLVLVALCFVVFWGTFFPLISEAVTGTEASVGPPWFDRYVTPLALVLVLLSGIGPADRLAARDGRQPAAQLRAARRGGRRCWCSPSLLAARRDAARPAALLMFALRRVRARGRRAGALARRARAAGDVARVGAGRARLARAAQPAPLRRLPRARRRSPCCSSASPRRRRSRTQRDVRARGPARPRGSAATTITYERPTSRLVAAQQRAARADRPRRRLRVRRGGEPPRHARDVQSYFPSHGPEPRPGLALLRGRGDERGRAARRAAARPLDRGRARHRPALRRGSSRATRCSRDATELSATERARRSSARRCAASAARYTDDPPPATFRLLVSPLVTWIWLGALIVFAGAADRALAGRRPGAAAGDRGGPGPRRARARTRVAAAWRCCWSSSCSRSPCW